MGLLDTLTNAAEHMGNPNAQVAGGLVDSLQQQPGGAPGVAQSFQQNGLGGLVQQWTSGQTTPASPDQVQQGVGTQLIDSIAQRTGMSPTMVKGGLAIALPILIHHLAQNGNIDQQGQPTGVPVQSHSGLLQSVLGRLL